MSSFLKKEDYDEPCCVLRMDQGPERIDAKRVISTLDSYLGRNDYDGGARHLKYWKAEAEAAGDMHGKLTVLNEQIGLYRKTGNEEECLRAKDEVLVLIDELELQGTITYGTTLVNAATGCKAFGKNEEALKLYRRAQEIYESTLSGDDEKLGALYNNMAIALAESASFREAEAYYRKALAIMETQEHGELERAVTYLNMADLVAAEEGYEQGEEKIGELLGRAEELMNTGSLPRDGYYAFFCEKCAPVFGHYGFFLVEKDLKERAREIYDRN